MQSIAQQVNSQGLSSGGYSWSMPGGGGTMFMSGDFATPASPEVVTSHVFPAQTLITQNDNIQRQGSHYRGENSGHNTLDNYSDQTPDMDSSYLMKILGNNSQWVEASDKVFFSVQANTVFSSCSYLQTLIHIIISDW